MRTLQDFWPAEAGGGEGEEIRRLATLRVCNDEKMKDQKRTCEASSVAKEEEKQHRTEGEPRHDEVEADEKGKWMEVVSKKKRKKMKKKE